jgi:pimeloyl-ACP methyl ester carboxylesterase
MSCMPNQEHPGEPTNLEPDGFAVHQGQGFDGTSLRYWTRRREGRWLVVCTGYGGTLPAWLPLFSALDPSWSILLWDYRGQFGSTAPGPTAPPILVSDHSRDLDVLLAHEGIERGVVMGWSVGVQVALEHFRRRSEQVSALVLINGACEQVLHAPLGRGAGAHLARGLARMLAPVADSLQPVLRPLFGWSRLARVASALGVVRGNVEAFGQALATWQELELGRWIRMTLAADDHRTTDMLGRVDVPCLITCGDRDLITPPNLARALPAQILGSELLVLSDATHYAIIERPAEVAAAIDDFLRRKLPWLR